MNRRDRWWESYHFFRLLYPALPSWRREKLINLAVSYWERPDRFK